MLCIQAGSSEELLQQLSLIDIAVPSIREDRLTKHSERYMAAWMLSTLAANGQLIFPLSIKDRDSPDFIINMAERPIGLECVEAIPEEWGKILAIRDKDFPEACIDVIKLPPEREYLTDKKAWQARTKLLVDTAKGETMGIPWTGSMLIRYWAEFQAHFINKKTELLRNGNYSTLDENWLLIEDNCPAPVWELNKRLEAAATCLEQIAALLQPPSFSHIFIGNNAWLIRLHPSPIQAWEMHNLWNSDENGQG